MIGLQIIDVGKLFGANVLFANVVKELKQALKTSKFEIRSIQVKAFKDGYELSHEL